MNIVAIGALCVGAIVGGLLGKFWSKSSKVGLKAAIAILGVLFTGAPVAFLIDLGEERWLYPAGTVIGILWNLVAPDLRKVGRGQRRAGNAGWWVSMSKVIAVAVGTLFLAAISLLYPPTRDADRSSRKSSSTTLLVMPCRLVWVYLGRYGNTRQVYLTPPAFRYAAQTSLGGPFPGIGDRIVMIDARNLVVPGYKSADASKKCNRMLEPPTGYRPETASDFIAGKVLPGQEFLINELSFLPSRDAEPTYIWASVRLP